MDFDSVVETNWMHRRGKAESVYPVGSDSRSTFIVSLTCTVYTNWCTILVIRDTISITCGVKIQINQSVVCNV